MKFEELQAENRKLARQLFWQVVLTALTFCVLIVAALQLVTSG